MNIKIIFKNLDGLFFSRHFDLSSVQQNINMPHKLILQLRRVDFNSQPEPGFPPVSVLSIMLDWITSHLLDPVKDLCIGSFALFWIHA
jgi:hypothetical protein